MKVLALNTAGRETQIAVVEQNSEFLQESSFSRHSENLFPLLENTLATANVKLSDFDAFACVVGPGSFTGIRIGLSVVKGFGFALNKPVISINSLELLAYNLIERDSKLPICAVINAGAGLVYHQIFERAKGENGEIILLKKTSPRVDKFSHFLGYLHSSYADSIDLVYFNNNEKVDLLHETLGESVGYSIEALAKLTRQKYNAGEFTDSKAILPLYLRVSQAENAVKKLEIAEANIDNIPDILSLEQQNDEWDLNWSEIATRQSFSNPNFHCYLAWSGGEVKGMVSIMLLPNEAEILRVNVLNSARLNGVASSLIDWLKEHLRDKCDAIFLEVNSQNYPAISLYKKCGFIEIGRRPEYYGEHQDALLMRCNLK